MLYSIGLYMYNEVKPKNHILRIFLVVCLHSSSNVSQFKQYLTTNWHRSVNLNGRVFKYVNRWMLIVYFVSRITNNTSYLSSHEFLWLLFGRVVSLDAMEVFLCWTRLDRWIKVPYCPVVLYIDLLLHARHIALYLVFFLNSQN